MQQQTKERIQYGSAMVVLAFAIALVYISYFVSKDVTDNVLWYFGINCNGCQIRKKKKNNRSQ